MKTLSNVLETGEENELLSCMERGILSCNRYLNYEGGLHDHLFSSKDSPFLARTVFTDFGGAIAISKILSTILEEGHAHFITEELKSSGLDMILRREDANGYDFILQRSNGKLIVEIEQKITTTLDEGKMIKKWTTNKYSCNKVPVHLLIPYRTHEDKISELGAYLVDKDADNSVIETSTKSENSGFGNIALTPEAMNSPNFVRLIGDISMTSMKGNVMTSGPQAILVNRLEK